MVGRPGALSPGLRAIISHTKDRTPATDSTHTYMTKGGLYIVQCEEKCTINFNLRNL